MKICITTVQAPFVAGGAELLAQNLKIALVRHGHEAEIVTIPFMDSPIDYIENHIVASRLFDLTNSWAGKIDLCIGLKFPAYYIPHDNKICWVLHQHRAAYELFNTEFSNIKDTPEGRHIRDVVTRADKNYLSEAQRIYTISQNVTTRMSSYIGLSSVPLYHPCPDMNKFYAGDYGDYILMPSRINITKRQLLAVEAMALTKSPVKLCIVGKADNDYEKQRLLKLIKEKKLGDKIKYLDFVSQKEKFKLYSNARAVLFIPWDEDYGYITLEAMAASKAVITANDSGGPLEFVESGRNGLVAEPTPASLAAAMDEIFMSKTMPRHFGEKSRELLVEKNINWTHVVKELTRK